MATQRRYTKALYRLKEERTNVPPRKERVAAVRNARNGKQATFDMLTGITPQVDFGIKHTSFDELRDVLARSKIKHEIDISPAVKATIEGLNTSFKDMFMTGNLTAGYVSDTIATAARDLNRTAEAGTSVIDRTMSSLMKLLWLVPLIGAAYFACTTVKSFMTVSAVAALGMFLSTILPEGLWEVISECWPKGSSEVDDHPTISNSDDEVEDNTVPQAGGISPSSLGHIISIALTYLTIGKKDPMGLVKGLMKEMPSYSRNVTSWTSLSGFLLEAIEGFVNHVRNIYGAKNITLMQSGIKAVDDWCARVMDVLNESHTGGEIMTPDNVQLLIALRTEGTNLTQLHRFTKEVSPMLHRYLSQLDVLCTTCSAAMHSFKGGRPQPVVLAITGKSGVGKTYLCKVLTTMVLRSLISKERAEELNYDFDSEVYMKGASEYWNGYAGQKAVIMDDWGQSVPVAGGENDFIDLIRMANCWSYPLNFADVENKGKNFFKSSFLLLTTNITNIDNCQKVIIAPDAITRRIDHGYEIVLTAEYTNSDGRLDYDKANLYRAEHGEYPYHAWNLYKYTFDIGSNAKRISPVPVGLKDIIDQIGLQIVRNEKMFTMSTTFNSDMLRKSYEDSHADKPIKPQSGEFFDCVSDLASATADLVGFTIKEYAHPKIKSCIASLKRTYAELLLYHTALSKQIWELASKPLVAFLLGTTAIGLILRLLQVYMPTVMGWFKPVVEKGKKVWNAIRKKKSIPDHVLAAAIDALDPADFQTAKLKDDGTYEVAVSFTPEVLANAYKRQTGIDMQSNEPMRYKQLPLRRVAGTTVVETDIKCQSDLYGDAIANMCSASTYKIRVEATEGSQTLGQILFVCGSVALMPEHFVEVIQAGIDAGNYGLKDHITLNNAISTKCSAEYTLEQFLAFPRKVVEGKDCLAIHFVGSIRAHRDLTTSFIVDSDLKHLSDIKVRVDTIEGKVQFVHRIRHMEASRVDTLKYSGGTVSKSVPDSFQYTGYTKYGDCGGVVTMQDTVHTGCRRIIGFHVAGKESTGIGFCNILSQELVLDLIHYFKVPTEIVPQCMSDETICRPPIEGSFLGLNKADKTYGMNPFSSLQRTKLHDAWGINPKRPAKLGTFVNKVGEEINPMVKAIEGYASPLLYFDENKIKRATYHAFEPTRKLTKKAPRVIYNFEQAVSGVDNTNINGIPRGTSPGYPYVLEGITSKRIFFGNDGEYSFDSARAAEVKLEVTRILDDAKNNIRNAHFYVDFLKDELRAPEKVQAGKSRLISASPMPYVIAFRMYFLAFTSAVQDTRINNGVALGINHYTEWDSLARKLKTKGPHCVAGDFKGFDTGEQPQIHWAILDEINDWYDDGPENARVRKVLWLEVVHSRHFGGLQGRADMFYQWNKSLSSGHPATTIINSYYGLVLFNLVWADIVGNARASDFWYHVYCCTYGDDNVLNIDEAMIPYFNQATIAEGMSKYGMTYTNEKKDGEVANTRTLSEISFLKRGFRYEKPLRVYVGPLELESALYTAYWARSKKLMHQNTKDNLEFSWSELSLHDPEVWDKYAPVMRSIYKERMSCEPKHFFTRDNYLDITMSLVPFWDK